MVSLQYPDWPERPRMARPANGPSRIAVCPGGQLLSLDRGFWEGSTGAARAVENPLAGAAEQFRQSIESASRGDLRPLSQRILLDLFSKRVGHRHRVSGCGSTEEIDVDPSASRPIQLFLQGRVALFQQTHQPVRRDSGQLSRDGADQLETVLVIATTHVRT